MSPKLDQLLVQALELDEYERGELACRLIDSLDEPFDDAAEVEAAWNVELERRLKEVEDGTVELIPADVAMRKLREELNQFKQRRQ